MIFLFIFILIPLLVIVIHNYTLYSFRCSRFDSLLIQLQTQNTTYLTLLNKCYTNKNKIRTFMKLTIPYYLHKAGAGFPSPATDYIEEDIDLNVHLIKNVPATFVIRVQGKSMTDVGINDGDILVVDKSLTPKNFSTVIANVHDELVVKSFVQERDKKFLTSGSKNFKDRILINEEEDIFIWGVVTYVIHSVY